MNCIVSGASSGIGREVCKYLLSKGHKVLAIARREGLLKELEDEEGYSYLATDLSSLSSEALTSKPSTKLRMNSVEMPAKEDSSSSSSSLIDTIATFGKVDIVINNAGALINKSFIDTTSEDFLGQYRSNVITAVNLVHACDPYIKEGSHIVNISSMGGFQGSSKYPGLAAYSAAKGALSILTECMAEEYKGRGVSVNALALGAVQTEMLAEAFPGFDAGTTPQEMAKFIADFAIGSGKLMSGQVIPVAKGNP